VDWVINWIEAAVGYSFSPVETDDNLEYIVNISALPLEFPTQVLTLYQTAAAPSGRAGWGVGVKHLNAETVGSNPS
jgi:hypothetical protein